METLPETQDKLMIVRSTLGCPQVLSVDVIHTKMPHHYLQFSAKKKKKDPPRQVIPEHPHSTPSASGLIAAAGFIAVIGMHLGF